MHAETPFFPQPARLRHRLLWLLPLALLCACATVVDEAERLAQDGRYEEALALLDGELAGRPADPALRTAHERQRERVVMQLAAQAELALGMARQDEAAALLARAQRLLPRHPRVLALAEAVAQAQAAQQRLAALPAPQAVAGAAAAPGASQLGPAFQKTVNLEFRDATLRQVFEALARSSGVNFVFDKDVRSDTRITVFLRQLSLDEAMRVILATQQLDRKLLNAQTVLVYPNTAAKQREHQELITRSLYLVNADVKQAQALVRTMTKTRDLHVDERLNALVVRDTPEVVDQIERLLATIDLAEPEVMLAVEVLEVSADRLDELGLNWPTTLSLGVPGGGATVPLSTPLGGTGFRGLVANPALAATLRSASGSARLLANPTIRARNREKAKVQIGERLPVFTTAAVANAGVSASVSYLDVGLKLDVEPSVQLDGEVTIKVALEVSNLLREVDGPAGSAAKAYEVGTRITTTSLRLKDGQTQVLAGLINDQDRQNVVGLPGVSRMPLLGALFGVQRDQRSKSEIVMLITPRIVRNLQAPTGAAATQPSGTESQPGAAPLRLAEQARAGVGGGRGAARAATTQNAPDAAPAALVLAASERAAVGGTLSVTLHNRSGQVARGELVYDANQLQGTSAAPGAAPGRLPFSMAPQSEAAFVLRVLPAAAGQRVVVQAQADAPVAGEAVTQIDTEGTAR
ncbi:secretin N-terminal domain-containing protein [Rubrivivax rivuli]|uniref:Type II secretion system protein GspD n=1 Tax=Rubrivivax rivuli TaxID=1862385 RepID=A0A437REC9_9BURK|nr:secretin N-terminal domain-containing protein [Rubrivivax rivuli]RVU45117.1 type II secretion system protein GspD [Rubrivivax rivuli]